MRSCEGFRNESRNDTLLNLCMMIDMCYMSLCKVFDRNVNESVVGVSMTKQHRLGEDTAKEPLLSHDNVRTQLHSPM